MDIIIGTVTSNSYNYIDFNGNYIMNFKLQVNRRVFIRGEIYVEYCNNMKRTFKCGDKIIAKGLLKYRKGLILITHDIKKNDLFTKV